VSHACWKTSGNGRSVSHLLTYLLANVADDLCRFTAVTRPISYARQKTSRRVYVMIAAPWIISLAISSPIALGLNRTARRADTPRLCTFYNSDFLIYSSMGSFYVPTIVMSVLYWRVYLVIRSRRCVATASGRSHADDSISCLATAPPPTPVATDVRREGADRGVTEGDQAFDSNAALSVVAATLSAVQRRGEELAQRMAAVTAVDGVAPTGHQPVRSMPELCGTLLPPIAVAEDDIATLTPPSASDESAGTGGLPLPASDQLTPPSAAGDDCSPAMTPDRCSSCASPPKNAPSTTRTEPGTNHLLRRCPMTTLAVPLEVSALGSRRDCSSMCMDSEENARETVLRIETPISAADRPLSERANGRFVTFFNFASKQQARVSTGADGRIKRAVRRERRATKTLAIVLGNFPLTYHEQY